MKNKMTNEEYNNYVKQKTPNSPVIKDSIKAFIVGGLICDLGELLRILFTSLDMSDKLASTAVSISLVFLSALFTGLNIYPKLGKFAGAGSIVPITGFANSVVSPAIEANTEGYVLGVGAKIFSIAGPVILYGALASMVAGVFYFVLPI